MSAGTLLSKLHKVKQTGAGRWIACCPAHNDRTPSLAVTEKPDGTVLINCFGGCGAAEVISAAGMEFSDLFPEARLHWEATNKGPRRERATFSPADILRIVASDALDIAVLASDLAKGVPVTDEIRARLWSAAGRISTGLEATNAARR